MADLGTLRPASPLEASDDNRLAFSNDLTETLGRALDNMPANFATMDTTSWRVEYRLTGALPDDTYALGIRIVNGATILAAATAAGAFATVNADVEGILDQTTGPTAFAYVNTTADKTTWDGATVELQQTYTQNMAKDVLHIEVDEVQITGTYSLVSTPATATPATTAAVGDVPAASLSTGVTPAPGAVDAPAGVPAPTISTSGDAAVDPAVSAAVGDVPAPAVATGSAPTPAEAAAVSAVPEASISTGSIVAPSAAAAAAGTPAATINTGGGQVVTDKDAVGALRAMAEARGLTARSEMAGLVQQLADSDLDPLGALRAMGATKGEIVGCINELADTEGLELEGAIRAWANSGNF